MQAVKSESTSGGDDPAVSEPLPTRTSAFGVDASPIGSERDAVTTSVTNVKRVSPRLAATSQQPPLGKISELAMNPPVSRVTNLEIARDRQ